jgi:hypothetical protein
MPSATGTEESCLWGSLWLNSNLTLSDYMEAEK